MLHEHVQQFFVYGFIFCLPGSTHGFYGICTDLEDKATDIIKTNGGRWIIEDCFRITKTEFEARPVYLQRDDRIKAHFLTCFLALILYKYLEEGQ